MLLLDVGKHRLGRGQQQLRVPAHTRPARPYTQGLFLSRLTPPSDDREVVRVPGFVLEMETLEYEWSDVIRSRLLTFWDKAMTVSVDVRHYKFVQALVSEFVEQYNTAVTNVHQQAKDMRETAKRAVDQQQRNSISSARGSRHLQLPTVSRAQSNSDSLSPRSVKFGGGSSKAEQQDGSNRGRAASANLLAGVVVTENGKVISTSSGSGGSGSGRSTMIKSLFHRKPESPIRLYHKDEQEEKKDSSTSSTLSSSSSSNTPNMQLLASNHVEDSQDDNKEGSTTKSSHPTASLTIDPYASSRTTSAASDTFDPDSTKAHHSRSKHGEDASGGGGSGSGSGSGSEKHIDVMGVVEFNPQIHVLDNTSSGISSRKVLELLGMKGDLSIIPSSTHQLTMLLDTLMEACHGLSRAIDKALE